MQAALHSTTKQRLCQMANRADADAVTFVEVDSVGVQFVGVQVENGRHVFTVNPTNGKPGHRAGQQPEVAAALESSRTWL